MSARDAASGPPPFMSSLSSSRLISELTEPEKELLCEEIGAYITDLFTPEEVEYTFCMVNDGLDGTDDPAACEAAMEGCYERGWFRGESLIRGTCTSARTNTSCSIPLDMFEGCVEEVAAGEYATHALSWADAPLGWPPWDTSMRYRSPACNAWLESCRAFVWR